MIFFLTQYLQGVLGYDALEAGIRTLPVAAGLVIGGPLSARLTAVLGTKRVVAAGMTIVAAGLLLLLGADVIGRVVLLPGEVPAGIMTALVGAPVFVWLIRRGKGAGL